MLLEGGGGGRYIGAAAAGTVPSFGTGGRCACAGALLCVTVLRTGEATLFVHVQRTFKSRGTRVIQKI